MLGILADVNCEGQFKVLTYHFEADAWRDIWTGLGLNIQTFASLQLPRDVGDVVLWQTCQHQQVVLLTANRKFEGSDSLEAAVRHLNTPASLPVITFANPDRIMSDQSYAELVAEKVLGYLLDIDQYRGTGRLYVP